MNIFGAKKNYLAKTAQVNFDKLIEFLLNVPLSETVAHSQKLQESVYLAKAWLLLLSDEAEAAVSAL